MSFHNLPNYLRTYRRRVGFSQDEVAYLLGVQTGAQVCRYERHARRPSLETAWSLEVILGAPARDLFLGDYRKVQGRVIQRAVFLIKKLGATVSDRRVARKLETLRGILSANRAAGVQQQP
jgi:transcriptional regulator with XRE-family HTH domain